MINLLVVCYTVTGDLKIFLISLISTILGIILLRNLDRLLINSLFIGFRKFYEDKDRKIYHIVVINEKRNFLINFIKPSQTAINCNAIIKVENADKKLSYKAHWVNTIKPTDTDCQNKSFFTQNPEPINIQTGGEQQLYLMVFDKNTNTAYNWSNDNYLTNSNDIKYQLPPGRYKFLIEIESDNNFKGKKKCQLVVLKDDGCYFELNS